MNGYNNALNFFKAFFPTIDLFEVLVIYTVNGVKFSINDARHGLDCKFTGSVAEDPDPGSGVLYARDPDIRDDLFPDHYHA
jgi:hypothetical protein